MTIGDSSRSRKLGLEDSKWQLRINLGFLVDLLAKSERISFAWRQCELVSSVECCVVIVKLAEFE